MYSAMPGLDGNTGHLNLYFSTASVSFDEDIGDTLHESATYVTVSAMYVIVLAQKITLSNH